MEKIDQLPRGRFSRQHNLELSLFIDKHLESAIDSALTPTHARVNRPEQEVHEVGLAESTEGEKLLAWQRRRPHVVKVANRNPLLNLARQKQHFLHVNEKEDEHLVEDFGSDQLWLLLCHAGHNGAIHDEAGAHPLIPPMQIEGARLQQLNRVIGQSWLDWDRGEPLDVLAQLFTCLIHIVKAGLDPLEPVSLFEGGWDHDALCRDKLFQHVHSVSLEIGQVVPAKVHSSVILCSVVCRNLTFLIGDEVVGIERWNVHRILHVVARVVHVVRIWVVDWLFKLRLVLL